jgi:hypothetical protein
MNSEDYEIVGNRVRIRRRGIKGTFCADFWHDGKHCRTSLKTRNRKIAVDRALDIAHSLKEGTYQQKQSEVNLKEAIDLFLAFHKTEGRADTTLTRYAGELRTLLEFCERRRIRRLSAVSASVLDAFRAERRKTRELQTVNHETSLIKGFSRWCRSRRLIAVDPLVEWFRSTRYSGSFSLGEVDSAGLGSSAPPPAASFRRGIIGFRPKKSTKRFNGSRKSSVSRSGERPTVTPFTRCGTSSRHSPSTVAFPNASLTHGWGINRTDRWAPCITRSRETTRSDS